MFCLSSCKSRILRSNPVLSPSDCSWVSFNSFAKASVFVVARRLADSAACHRVCQPRYFYLIIVTLTCAFRKSASAFNWRLLVSFSNRIASISRSCLRFASSYVSVLTWTRNSSFSASTSGHKWSVPRMCLCLSSLIDGEDEGFEP